MKLLAGQFHWLLRATRQDPPAASAVAHRESQQASLESTRPAAGSSGNKRREAQPADTAHNRNPRNYVGRGCVESTYFAVARAHPSDSPKEACNHARLRRLVALRHGRHVGWRA